jgi:cell division protein FtsZ
MKGARGLLISITGGKDLTLFEVDEAATRIREEVDQDANIIVGATFDESLDGDPRHRAACLGRGDRHRPARTAPMQPASYGDVTVRPIAQKPSLFPDHDARAARAQEPATPETFIPQRPNVRRSARRGCRSSKTCRCPRRPRSARPAAKRGGAASAKDPDVAAAAPRQCRPRPPRRRDRAADRGPRLRSGDGAAAAAAGAQAAAQRRRSRSRPTSRYRNMPAAGAARLDAHGRPAPVAPAPQGDDHLDIPAFLRRQAN